MTENEVTAIKGQPQSKEASLWTYGGGLRLTFEETKLVAIWSGHALTAPKGKLSTPTNISTLSETLTVSLGAIKQPREGYPCTLQVNDGNVLVVWVAYEKATSFDLVSKGLAEKG